MAGFITSLVHSVCSTLKAVYQSMVSRQSLVGLSSVCRPLFPLCEDLKMTESQPINKRGARVAREWLKYVSVLLLLLIIGVGEMWGETPTLDDLEFSTSNSVRIVNEDFNSLNTVTKNATVAVTKTDQTEFGVFNCIYNNNTSNSYSIVNNENGFSDKSMSLSAGSGSPLIMHITGKTWGSKGAFRIRTTKTSTEYIGFYGETSGNIYAKAKSTVYLSVSSGSVGLHNGGTRKSDGFVNVGSYTTDIIDICVIYNTTNSATTYGDNISLAANKAHVYINGTCVMNGSSPKAFSIAQTTLTSFRVAPQPTSGNKAYVDDVQIWNALPTAAPTCTPLGQINGSINWSNGTEATLTWDNLDHVASYTVTYKTGAGDYVSTNVGDISTNGAGKKNCSITGLTPGTAYTFKIAATAAGGYCDKSQEITATAPLITASGTIDGLNYAEGSGTSTAKTFTVSGVGLTGDITVTAPTNFEVCKTSDGIYASSVSFSPTSGTLAGSTVYVRLAEDKSVGTYNGNITISGGGAANNTSVSVSGVVSVACHTPNITGQPASSTTYNLNATATALSVTAAKGDAGDPTLTYQWYSNTANSKTTPEPTLISGAMSSSYTPLTSATGTKYYFCEVSSGICSTTSNIAAVTVNTPTITVSETARAFGERAINGSYTMTFTVSGSTLAKDAGISLALSGTNATLFSIDRTSLSATSNAVATTTITVTYSPNAVGSHSAQIDITSTGATTKTVALSGSVSNYTLTWNFTTGGSSSETAGTHYTAGGSVAHGAALTYPSDVSMSKNGYTFTGWSSSATHMPAEALTITAQWEAKQYTVTLDNKSATTSGSTSVTATFGQAIPTIIPPTKTGYRFDGYWTTASGGTKYINADGTSAHTYDKYSSDPATHKLHAHWVAQLTFSVNGEVEDDLTRDDNTAMPTSATVPASCGDCWAFMGWSTNSSESGAPAYAGGATNEFGEPTTLYAVFGKAEYEWISSTSGLVANDYYVLTNIVSSKEYAISNTAPPTYSNDASSTEVTDKIRENAAGYILYNPAANNIWKFTGTKDAGQLQNVGNTSLYLNLTGTGSILSTTNNLTFTLGDYGQWTINSTKYLRHYSANDWDAVSTLTSGDFSCYLYHQTSAEYATIPSCETYDIVWKVNGTPLVSGSQTEETNACAGIEELPTDPDDDELDCATKFMGWSESTLIGTGKSAPADLFTTVGNAPAIDGNKTFYAVFASVDAENSMEATDNITYSVTGLGYSGNSQTYTAFSDASATSDAVYAGMAIRFPSNSSSDFIQIKSDGSNTGIVTTTSGGFAKKVTITFASSNTNENAINIYGKNTAYTAASELYNSETFGTLLGTITSSSTELTITGDYKYIGICSAKNAFYLDNIAIKWESAAYKDYMTSCCDELVTLTTNSPENGTITFLPAGPIATCEANQNVTMTITPSPGYKLSDWSVATGDGKVAAVNTDPSVVTGENNSDEQEITLTFNQHTTGNYDVSATFEQMHDEYYDYMHDNAKVGANRTDSYSAPSRTSKTAASGEDCKTNHYKFRGWVVSTEINDDGTLKSGYTLITAGSSMTASNKIYYAVWAEEQ